MTAPSAAHYDGDEMVLRDATDDDLRFVCGSWLQGCKVGPMLGLFDKEGLTGDLFWKLQRERIHALLSRSVVTVAVKPDGLIAAWVCIERGVLHYAYVRWMDRHEGTLARMLKAEGLT